VVRVLLPLFALSLLLSAFALPPFLLPPVWAQQAPEFGTQTLTDMTVYVLPESGPASHLATATPYLCLDLPAGTLTATVRQLPQPPWPASAPRPEGYFMDPEMMQPITLYSHGGWDGRLQSPNPPPALSLFADREPASQVITLTSPGIYCWGLRSAVSRQPDASGVDQRMLARRVTVRMTFTPTSTVAATSP
jgi:hypothetical protein